MTGGVGPGSFDPNPLDNIRPRPVPPAYGAGPPAKPGRFSNVAQVWKRAIFLVVGFIALLYAIEGIDQLTGDSLMLDNGGIQPKDTDGLSGILFAPFLHGGWDHLIANTVPVFVLGLLTLMSGIGRGLAATAIIWIVAGAGVWMFAEPGPVHVGASSLVFGWLTFLISRGLFTRNIWQIVIGVVVGVAYGSILTGVLPGQPGISWQGHLFGAVGGVLAGWVLSGDARRHRRGDTAGRPATPG